MNEIEHLKLIAKSEKGEEAMIDIEIDSLTNCLKEKDTGKIFDTTYTELRKTISKSETKQMIKLGWCFDWNKPFLEGNQIYALQIAGKDEIEGLIALKHFREDYYTYVSLVESAPHNRKNHKFLGVGAHLFAIACKLSFEAGNEGYVVFDAKTNLIKHYSNELNAKLIGGQRMVIETTDALELVKKYFKEETL